MHITTSITNITSEGKEYIRGTALETIVKEHTFTEAIIFLLFGTFPSKAHTTMMDAIFTATIDHGPGTASALAARLSASTKNAIHTSLAAGILSLGEKHGLAVEAAMNCLYTMHKETDIDAALERMKEKKIYVPGLGHKLFTTEDPRATTLFTIAKEQHIFGTYCQLFHDIHKKVNSTASKPLPINIDGAIAAILCDMNIPAQYGNSIFLISRIPGLLAHIHEETEQQNGIRRLSEEEISCEETHA